MHYNIIIIGGGLVGKSIACALRHTNLSIALIDASAYDKPDPRLIALNYGSFSFLNQIDAWQHIEPYSAPINEVHVSHRGQFGTTCMRADAIDLPALGYVVRARHINKALDAEITQLTELRPAVLSNIQLKKPYTIITLEQEGSHQEITGDLILAADGTYSTARQLLHFEAKKIDYHQSAIVAVTTLNRSHFNIAYERFLDDGAIAMLPLRHEQEYQVATIWTASTIKISQLLELNDEDFLKELQSQFGYRLGKLKAVSSRAVFPLHFIHVKNPIKENVILIGNAAHTIHPIGAQGLNLALYEIAHLTQALSENIKMQQPLTTHLAKKLPQFHPKINLTLSHYLNPLFSSNSWVINLARQTGMVAFDICSPLKNQFSRLLAMESVKWLNNDS